MRETRQNARSYFFWNRDTMSNRYNRTINTRSHQIHRVTEMALQATTSVYRQIQTFYASYIKPHMNIIQCLGLIGINMCVAIICYRFTTPMIWRILAMCMGPIFGLGVCGHIYFRYAPVYKIIPILNQISEDYPLLRVLVNTLRWIGVAALNILGWAMVYLYLTPAMGLSLVIAVASIFIVAASVQHITNLVQGRNQPGQKRLQKVLSTQIIEAIETGDRDLLIQSLSAGGELSWEASVYYLICKHRQYHLLDVLPKYKKTSTRDDNENLLDALLRGNLHDINYSLSCMVSAEFNPINIDLFYLIPGLMACGLRADAKAIKKILDSNVPVEFKRDFSVAHMEGENTPSEEQKKLVLKNMAEHIAECMDKIIERQSTDHQRCAILLWRWLTSTKFLKTVHVNDYTFIHLVLKHVIKKAHVMRFIASVPLNYTLLEESQDMRPSPRIIRADIHANVSESFKYFFIINDVDMVYRLIDLRLSGHWGAKMTMHKREYNCMLHQACQMGNLLMLKALLQVQNSCGDIHAGLSHDEAWRQPREVSNMLEIAVAQGHGHVAMYLLSLSNNCLSDHVESFCVKPIITGLRAGQFSVVEQLLAHRQISMLLSNTNVLDDSEFAPTLNILLDRAEPALHDMSFDIICALVYKGQTISATHLKVLTVGSILLGCPKYKVSDFMNLGFGLYRLVWTKPNIIVHAVKLIDPHTIDPNDYGWTEAQLIELQGDHVPHASASLGWAIFGKMLSQLHSPTHGLPLDQQGGIFPREEYTNYMLSQESLTDMQLTFNDIGGMVDLIWTMRAEISRWIEIYDSLSDMVSHYRSIITAQSPSAVPLSNTAISTSTWSSGMKLLVIKQFASAQGSNSDHQLSLQEPINNRDIGQITDQSLSEKLHLASIGWFNEWLDAIWEMRLHIHDWTGVVTGLNSLVQTTSLDNMLYSSKNPLFQDIIQISELASKNRLDQLSLCMYHSSSNLTNQIENTGKIMSLGQIARFTRQIRLAEEYFAPQMLTHPGSYMKVKMFADSFMDCLRLAILPLFQARELNRDCGVEILSYLVPIAGRLMYTPSAEANMTGRPVTATELMEAFVDAHQFRHAQQPQQSVRQDVGHGASNVADM